jgi:RNA polymerase sigma factor (sigma-70 family)
MTSRRAAATPAVPGHASTRSAPLELLPAQTPQRRGIREVLRPSMPTESTGTGQRATNAAHETAADMPRTALDIAEIAAHYAALLCGIGRRYRLTPQEQEDAAQSTWLALCENAHRIRDPQCLPGWLATTMRRFSAAAIRRRHRENPASNLLDIDTLVVSAAPDLADTVADRHATVRLYQAVAQLPDRQRRLIQLQLSPTEPEYKQISRTMQMPVGSIGPVRGRALRRLRVLLRDLE